MSMNLQSCSLFLLFHSLITQEVLFCFVKFCIILVWKWNFFIREKSLWAVTTTTDGLLLTFLQIGSQWGFRLRNIKTQSNCTSSGVINWPQVRTCCIYFIASAKIEYLLWAKICKKRISQGFLWKILFSILFHIWSHLTQSPNTDHVPKLWSPNEKTFLKLQLALATWNIHCHLELDCDFSFYLTLNSFSFLLEFIVRYFLTLTHKISFWEQNCLTHSYIFSFFNS